MSTEKETYQADKILDHEFDGIQEFDNRLPNWWLWLLWGTIVFAVGYWLIFHTYGLRDLPVAKYDKAMEASNAFLADSTARGLTEQDLVAMSLDPAKTAQGLEVWRQYCVVCHKETGEGLVGPNLTDGYWIHGGSPLEIHGTVVLGVLDKGMAAWGRQLGPERVDAVVAWVLTIRDTNVPGKAPEGELYQAAPEEPAEEPVEEAAAVEAGEAVAGEAVAGEAAAES